MKRWFTDCNITVFTLVFMSVQFLAWEGGTISLPKVAFMCLTPFLIVMRAPVLSKAILFSVLYWVVTVAVRFLYVSSPRMSTFYYALMFLSTFCFYYNMVYIRRVFVLEDFLKVVKLVIYAYAGCLVLQQACMLVGIRMFPLLNLLHTPSEIIGEAYSYISIITRFTLVMFAYNLCAGILRAVGNSIMPLIFLIVSSLTNILLDYIFIAVFGRGLGGAAEATVIAQSISVLLCLVYIAKASPVLIPKKENFNKDIELYKEMAAQGLSMGFMSCLVSAGSVILQSGINGLGYMIIAAHTSARRMYQFCMIPFIAMMQTINTFVSQNYGARKAERIRKAVKYAYLYTVAVTVIITLVIWIFASDMIRLISGSDEMEVLKNGTWYLRIVAPCYFILGVLNISRTSLQAIGQKILPVLSSVIELIGKILFTAYFIPKLGYAAVIVCEPVIWCFMVAELLAAFWKNPFIRGKDTDNV